MTWFLLYLLARMCFYILIYIFSMPGTADLYFYYQGTVYTLENHCLIRLRNSYQSFKYYLNDIDIAFRVLSSSHSILTTISVLLSSLSFGSFLCNINKTFLWKIKGGFVSIFFHIFCLFFSQKLFFRGDIHTRIKV